MRQQRWAYVVGILLGAMLIDGFVDTRALAESHAGDVELLRRELEGLGRRLDEADRRRNEDAARIHALEAEVVRLQGRRDVGADAGTSIPASAVAPDAGAVEPARGGPAMTAPPSVEAVAPAEPATATAPIGAGAPTLAERLDAFNPRITVVGNGLLRLDDRKVYAEDDGGFERVDNQFRLRETEFDFRAAIDPYADGVLIAAVAQEPTGEFETEIEEGYALIKQFPFLERPPGGLVLKVGRFRTEFGRLNRLHTHDLPQSTRPLVVKTFLGGEGHIADGASARFLLPSLLDEESAWELTMQAVQGGDVAVASGGKHDPNVLANLRWSRLFGDAHLADIAGIFDWGTTDTDSDPAYTYSLDWMYKWKPPRRGQWRSVVLGGQLFYANRDFAVDNRGGPQRRAATPFGYYVFGQYQFDRRLYAGLRWDWTEQIDDDAATRQAIQPYISYYFSEFLRFRIGYEHRWNHGNGADDLNTVLGEINFLFGSHPPEPFWVNP